MTELSPAAQAVLDAINKELDEGPWDLSFLASASAAAALRAAADQAENVHPARPSTEWGEGWLEGVKDVIAGFRRIANELETNA